MAKKPDLAASLAEVSGSTRRKPEPVAPSNEPQTGQEPSEKDTAPITVRFPIQVRTQLKIMAAEQKTTVNNHRARILALVSVALLVIAVALIVGRALPVGGPRTVERIDSLAVLPLQNFSVDPEQEYFADGMTEALITELAHIRALRVISRTSIVRYKGTKKSTPEIASELGVQAIAEGAVARAGERMPNSTQ